MSRQLQRIARTASVLEKRDGKWRLTSLGQQVSRWTQDVAATQQRILRHKTVLGIASTRANSPRARSRPTPERLLGDGGGRIALSILASEVGVEQSSSPMAAQTSASTAGNPGRPGRTLQDRVRGAVRRRRRAVVPRSSTSWWKKRCCLRCRTCNTRALLRRRCSSSPATCHTCSRRSTTSPRCAPRAERLRLGGPGRSTWPSASCAKASCASSRAGRSGRNVSACGTSASAGISRPGSDARSSGSRGSLDGR